MPLPTIARQETLLARLVHDLRQPLGNIETSVYLLNLLTAPEDQRVHAQLHAIECQLNDATRLLAEASAELGRLRAQRAPEPAPELESLDLTNPVTADVT